MPFTDTERLLRVLIVEDNPDDAELLILELESEGYTIEYQRVDTAAAMQAALQNDSWQIVLSDYSMPTFSAEAALALLQAQGQDIPFIIVSGTIGEEIAVAAMRAGAHDYLLKQNLTRLIPAIERELRDAQVRQERRQALERIERLAFYDELTGLPNRTLFLDSLRDCVAECARNCLCFAVLVLDIDRYKGVKYGFGHIKGNQFLIAVVHRLQANLQPGEKLARVGEDSFALLLTAVADLDATAHKAAHLHTVLHEPFLVDKSRIFSSVSIGIVDSTIDYARPEDFLRAADAAAYHAKRLGVGQTVRFDQRMHTEEQERLRLEADLQQAIQLQQLQLYYQPIVALQTGTPIGAEALVRWQHPTRGWVSPSEFIPVAEQTGLITALGDWVLATACEQLTRWQTELAAALPFSVAVNLSGIQLTQPELVDRIRELSQLLDVTQVCLEVEITESVLMKNAEAATTALEHLQACNVQVSIDDFGTGYSSLAYLHCLPIDTLKIDQSFVHRMLEDSRNFDIVKAIITLAHTLDIDVVAEGIETADQLEVLQSLSCDYGQGYFFARPMPAAALANWITDRNERSGNPEQLEHTT